MAPRLLVPFGLKEGRLFEPSQVPNGKACSCVCPACKSPVIAKQNAATPHFAHAQDENCTKSLETAIHLAAKQIIAERKELFLPELSYLNIWSKSQRRTVIRHALVEPLQDVAVECWLEDIRPDLIATINNQQYLVEIAVSHFVDESKMEKIRRISAPTIEIDASELQEPFTFNALEELIYNRPSKTNWLYHPKTEELALDAQKQYQEELDAEHRAKLQAKEERENKFKKYRELPPKEKLRRNLKGIGLTEDKVKLLSAFVPWDNSFGVHRIVWQSAVLAYIANEEEEQGWGEHLPCNINVADCISWLRQVFVPKPPVKDGDSIAVWKYFKHLESLGMLKHLSHKDFDLMLRNVQWDWLSLKVKNKAISD